MTLSKKIAVALVATLALFSVGIFAGTALANPSSFITVPASATATSTLIYIASGGSATSTAVDSMSATAPSAYSFGRNALLVQYVASSTSAVLGIRFQYSQDGVDWYDDNYSAQATSTQTIALQTFTNYSWTPVSVATSSKIINVPAPVRYTRAVFTETGAAGAVWYQWVPAREDR